MSEVQVDDDQVAEELFREQQSKGPAPPATGSNGVAVKSHHSTAGETDDHGTSLSERYRSYFSSGSVLDDDRWGDIYEDMPAKRKLALYDYDPQVKALCPCNTLDEMTGVSHNLTLSHCTV